jgi:hypothetical protein
VEQLQGDAGLLPLGVEVGAVGDGAAAAGGARRTVEADLEGVVGERRNLGPVEPGRLRAQHDGADGAVADAEALGHRAMGAAQNPLLSQDLSGVTHGESLGRHPASFRGMASPMLPRHSAPGGHPPVGRILPP